MSCGICGGWEGRPDGFIGHWCRCPPDDQFRRRRESPANQALRHYFDRDKEALVALIHRLTKANIMTEKHVIESIARVCHEVNRQYCASHGDYSVQIWELASGHQRASALKNVEMHLNNPKATPEDSHNAWMAEKVRDGWKYGAYKDEANKLHPCMVPYAELDERQRAKDYIFRGIVHAIAHEMVRGA